jgi:ribonucleotide reductase alpha subunit
MKNFKEVIYKYMTSDNNYDSDSDISEEEDLYVITRSGNKELLNPDKITLRLEELINRPPTIGHVKARKLMIKVCKSITSGNTTSQIDEYAAQVASSMGVSNPNYNILAGRIAIDNAHKNSLGSFLDKMRLAYNNTDEDDNYDQSEEDKWFNSGETEISTTRVKKHVPNPLISAKLIQFVEKYADRILVMMDYSRDFLFDFFGFSTFRKIYSIQINKNPIEQPQDTCMRQAIQVSGYSNYSLEMTREEADQLFDDIKETYDLLSLKYYTHASPTIFNSGAEKPQLASCFLLGSEDSTEGIENTGRSIALISRYAGGLGINVHSWRSTGTKIKGTNGVSNGVRPFLRTYDTKVLAYNQGGRRPGSAAIYLTPHHPDFMQFLEMRKNNGLEEERARNLYYAIWAPSLFLKRVKNNEMWSFFDPKKAGDLSKYYGEEYEKRYLYREKLKLYSFQLPARQVWEAFIQTDRQVGNPFMCFSDNANEHNMQSNIGIINGSNLCVTGDTLILTDKGYFPIKALCDRDGGKHKVWNGKKFSLASFSLTGKSRSDLLKIIFSDHSFVTCTPEHIFILPNGVRVSAEALYVGVPVLEPTFPVIEGGRNDFYCPYGHSFHISCNDRNIERIVPLDQSKHIRLEWLAGLFDSSKPDIVSDDVDFLGKVKLMCNTLGVNPYIKFVEELKRYRLEFSENDIKNLYNTGLRTFIHNGHTAYENKFSVAKIESVSAEGDVYCFNEPEEHCGIFNGVMAGNCTEIYQYSSSQEYATCVLASIALPMFVVDTYTEEELKDVSKRVLNHEFPVNPKFDFNELLRVVKRVVKNLNNVIDSTFLPVIEAIRGNQRQRAIGTGVQGLDDVFAKMRIPFDSAEARDLNKKIFECIYYAAITTSAKLSRQVYLDLKRECREKGFVTVKTYNSDDYGEHFTTYIHPDDIPEKIGAYPAIDWNSSKAYPSGEIQPGSHYTRGTFHWELYGLTEKDLCGLFDWETTRQLILKFGVRNSLVTAIMPTASTSQYLGNNECIEICTSNMYTRDTIAGQYVVAKKYLAHDLFKHGLWTKTLQDFIAICDGSIQNIEGIPQEFKDLYKTAYDIDPIVLIDQAADRQPFIDQGQSLNFYVNADEQNVTNMTRWLFHGEKRGLKTGKYYTRTKLPKPSVKFSIDPRKEEEMNKLIENMKREKKEKKNTETASCFGCT